MGLLLSLLAAAGGGIIRLLLHRWFDKDPEKEELHDALEARTREAEAYTAPARDKRDVVERLRDHQGD